MQLPSVSRITPLSSSLEPIAQNPQVISGLFVGIFHNKECIMVGSKSSPGFEHNLSMKVKQRQLKVPPNDRPFYFRGLQLS